MAGPRTALRLREALRGRPVEIVPLVDAGAPDDTEYRVRVFAHQSTKRMLAENVKSTGSDYGYATSTAGFLEPSERPLARRLRFERTLFMPPSIMATSTIRNMPTQTRNVPANPLNPTGRLAGKWLGRKGDDDACEMAGAMFVGDDGSLVSCEAADPADPSKGRVWRAASGANDAPDCSPDRDPVWDAAEKQWKCTCKNLGSKTEPADGSCFPKAVAGATLPANALMETCPDKSRSVLAAAGGNFDDDPRGSDRNRVTSSFRCLKRPECPNDPTLAELGVHLVPAPGGCAAVDPAMFAGERGQASREIRARYDYPRNVPNSFWRHGGVKESGQITLGYPQCKNGKMLVNMTRGWNLHNLIMNRRAHRVLCLDYIPIFATSGADNYQTVEIRSPRAILLGAADDLATGMADAAYWGTVGYRPESHTGTLSCDPLPNGNVSSSGGVFGWPAVKSALLGTGDAPGWCMFHQPGNLLGSPGSPTAYRYDADDRPVMLLDDADLSPACHAEPRDDDKGDPAKLPCAPNGDKDAVKAVKEIDGVRAGMKVVGLWCLNREGDIEAYYAEPPPLRVRRERPLRVQAARKSVFRLARSQADPGLAGPAVRLRAPLRIPGVQRRGVRNKQPRHVGSCRRVVADGPPESRRG